MKHMTLDRPFVKEASGMGNIWAHPESHRFLLRLGSVMILSILSCKIEMHKQNISP